MGHVESRAPLRGKPTRSLYVARLIIEHIYMLIHILFVRALLIEINYFSFSIIILLNI